MKAFWVNGLRAFWNAVARQCDGDEDLMAGIEQGVKGFVSYAKEHELARYGAEARGLMDDFRLDRDTTTFQPKGDGLLGA